MTPGMFIRKVVRRLAAIIRWQQRLHAWEAKRFDRRLGIDTAGYLELSDLTVAAGDASHGIGYLGTQPRLARWWLSAMPSDPEKFTFVDMGAGKGRVLAIAAQHGFRRAVGIEFTQELHSAAVENARALRRRGVAIEPVLGDAGDFEFPQDPLVVHFNNPFHEPVMRRVIAKLSSSYEARPRPIVVVYQQMTIEQPEHATSNLALLDDVPFLTGRTLARPDRWIDRRMVAPFTVRVYESPEVDRDGPPTL
jgi:SAM-dependent methyltransferase